MNVESSVEPGWRLDVSRVLSVLWYVSVFWLCDCLAGILEIRTVSEGGILAIKGVKSQYYISMNKAGQLQGKVILFLSETFLHSLNIEHNIMIFLTKYLDIIISATITADHWQISNRFFADQIWTRVANFNAAHVSIAAQRRQTPSVFTFHNKSSNIHCLKAYQGDLTFHVYTAE